MEKGTPTIEILQDEMKAFLILPQGNMFTVAEIEEALKKAGVVYGIKEDVLKNLAQTDVSQAPAKILIAEGTLPQEAIDGRIELKFKLGRPLDEIESKERIDLKETYKYLPVKEGQVLAEIIPAIDGVIGKTVTGRQLLPTKKKGILAAKLRTGQNVKIENNQYIATSDGMLTCDGREILVMKEFRVDGDVGYDVGNIHVPYLVTVKGSVEAGFLIEAGKDVFIGGDVNDAKIVCNANVRVQHGIMGTGKTVVRVTGDVLAGFIESSTIISGGTITSRDHIINSHLQAEGKIIVVSGKGTIVGGEVRAGHGIECRVAGSPSAIQTKLTLTGGLKYEEERDICLKKIREVEEILKKIRLTIGEEHLKIMLENETELQKFIRLTRKPIIRTLVMEYKKQSALLPQLKQKEAELLEAMERSQNSTIKIQQNVFEGTIITIGHLELLITETLKGCIFSGDFQEKKIKIQSV